MTDALGNQQGTVSIGGRTITNLRFADDIDSLAGDEQELANLVERLEKTSTSYGMEISAEKTKLMTNNTQGISTEVKVNGQKLETVKSFRYLGSIITDEGSKPEILARIAQTTAALTRLKPLWNDRNITVSSKIRLMRSLVMSIFLYASETWTPSADLQKRIQAMEMRCFRKILRISHKDHVTNKAVRNKIKQAIGPYDDLLTTVKKHKLKWYGHVSRSSGVAKTILQGTARGGRRRGRQKKRWEDNIKEWTGMEFADSQKAVENRETWRELVLTSKETRPKWDVIRKALTKPASILDFYSLKEAILSYNENDKDLWDFGGLQHFLNEELDDGERTEFFNHVLPEMAKLALNLPQLCSQLLSVRVSGSKTTELKSQIWG
ncbi:hypothetical protein LSAT2_001654 [Lamellibrachia satsuma]|nr:hypothetical protein LSAT2_001654 [Lamellibrachia satsuma]